MKKMSKLIVLMLAVLVVVALPACRSNRRKVEPPKTETATSTIPDVPPPPVQTGTPVEPTRDFVNETPDPTEDVFPTEIEELNRFVQTRGYIRDAFYNYDEATLDESAQAALTASANWLKSSEGANYRLLIEGHCDERGTEQYNLALGDRRANSAKDYLATLGVDASRIRTVSYGEERPFEEGQSDSAMAQNRRAHLVLVR
jgi:peptidoglycan-associated lipoprotein